MKDSHTGLVIFALSLLLALVGGCSSDDSSSSSGHSPSGTIAVNDGDSYTTTPVVSLQITSQDDGDDVASLRLSTSLDFSSSPWLMYSGNDTIINWPLPAGDGQVTVYAQLKDEAESMSTVFSDDILLAAASTIVCYNPDPLYLSAGAEDVVELMVINAQQLFSARFEISFDADKLEVQSIEVASLSNQILEKTGAAALVSDASYDNDQGKIIIGALGLQDGFTGVNGDGPFAEITFKAKTALSTPTSVAFDQIEMYNYAAPPVLASNVFDIAGSVQAP